MMRCSWWLAVTIVPGFLMATLSSAHVYSDASDELLLVGTWGGPYEAAQRAALFTPFERASDVSIQTSDYTGGLDVFDKPSPPDIFDMLEEEAEVACQAGLLKSFDYESLLDATIPASSTRSVQLSIDDFNRHDFYNGSFARCSVAHLTFSTLLACDECAFTGEKPKLINDLFDLQRFPGKLAL